MTELVNRYIGRECVIYTMNSQLTGVIREIHDGWLLIDNGTDNEAINLDYVIRVRPYPTNKKGKKKAVIVD